MGTWDRESKGLTSRADRRQDSLVKLECRTMEGPDESRRVRPPLFTINCIREAVCRQYRFAAAGILLSALRPRRPAG